MRPCYQGELGCGRFVPVTVPLSTNKSSWPSSFRELRRLPPNITRLRADSIFRIPSSLG